MYYNVVLVVDDDYDWSMSLAVGALSWSLTEYLVTGKPKVQYS